MQKVKFEDPIPGNNMVAYVDNFHSDTGQSIQAAVGMRQDEYLAPESSFARIFPYGGDPTTEFSAVIKSNDGEVRGKVVVRKFSALESVKLLSPFNYTLFSVNHRKPFQRGEEMSFYHFALVSPDVVNLAESRLRPEMQGTREILNAIGVMIRSMHESGLSHPSFTAKSLVLSRRGIGDNRFSMHLVSMIDPYKLVPRDNGDNLELDSLLLSVVSPLTEYTPEEISSIASLYRQYILDGYELPLQ